ncbi:hypothetical protein Bca101_072291 [Brassica carinata]
MLFLDLVCNGTNSVGVWFSDDSIWFLRLVFKEEGSRPLSSRRGCLKFNGVSLLLPWVSFPLSASWLLVWFRSSRMSCGLCCSPNKVRRSMSLSLILLSRWVHCYVILSVDLVLLIILLLVTDFRICISLQ